jgi:hypothetical protein
MLFFMEFPFVKIVVFVPVEHGDAVRKVMAEKGAGKLGNYDCCSFSSRGIGRFRPLEGSDPFIGKEGAVEAVEEERIEVICPREKADFILSEIRNVHPYEMPAIDIYPLLNKIDE